MTILDRVACLIGGDGEQEISDSSFSEYPDQIHDDLQTQLSLSMAHRIIPDWLWALLSTPRIDPSNPEWTLTQPNLDYIPRHCGILSQSPGKGHAHLKCLACLFFTG